jgi:hypothetical protein
MLDGLTCNPSEFSNMKKKVYDIGKKNLHLLLIILTMMKLRETKIGSRTKKEF